jgi:plastocyanin
MSNEAKTSRGNSEGKYGNGRLGGNGGAIGASTAKRPVNPWMAGTYLLVVAVVLVVAAGFLRPLLRSQAAGQEESNVVYVEAYMSGFSVKRIEAKVGQPITVRLRSMDTSAHLDGGGKHQLAIDELGVNIIAPPKGVSEATFTPTQPGTYTFYCDICCGGRANPTMRGDFVVTL